MKRRVNIYIEEDDLFLARIKYPGFNFSEFCSQSLQNFLFSGEIPENPIHSLARDAADNIIKERANQKKLIEEARSYEQIVIEMKAQDDAVFLENAEKIFDDPDRYIKFLPGVSSGNNTEFWKTKAHTLSALCNFPVTPERVQSYIREVSHVA